MKYLLIHPVKGCNTEIGGIRFVDGKAETDLTAVQPSFAATVEEAVEHFRGMGVKVVEADKAKRTEKPEKPGQTEQPTEGHPAKESVG
jgi:hypothetical protein